MNEGWFIFFRLLIVQYWLELVWQYVDLLGATRYLLNFSALINRYLCVHTWPWFMFSLINRKMQTFYKNNKVSLRKSFWVLILSFIYVRHGVFLIPIYKGLISCTFKTWSIFTLVNTSWTSANKILCKNIHTCIHSFHTAIFCIKINMKGLFIWMSSQNLLILSYKPFSWLFHIKP